MMNELMMFERGERAVVSSRTIAEKFDKAHASVLKSIVGENRDGVHINGYIDEVTSSGFPRDLYFIKSRYTDSYGRAQPEILCTRRGFSLVAMGFTGTTASRWKIKYIEGFEAMDAFIRERLSTEWLVTRKQGKLVRRNETDAISLLIPYAEAQGSKNMAKQAYTIYTKLVNALVGIESGQRDSIPFKTLSTITFLEDMIQNVILEETRNGTYYKEIYKKCKANGELIMRFAYLPKTIAG